MIDILDGARMGSKLLDLAEMTSGVGQSSSSTVTPDSGHSPLSSQHCSALSPSEASTMTSEQAVTNKDHHTMSAINHKQICPKCIVKAKSVKSLREYFQSKHSKIKSIKSPW